MGERDAIFSLAHSPFAGVDNRVIGKRVEGFIVGTAQHSYADTDEGVAGFGIFPAEACAVGHAALFRGGGVAGDAIAALVGDRDRDS